MATRKVMPFKAKPTAKKAAPSPRKTFADAVVEGFKDIFSPLMPRSAAEVEVLPEGRAVMMIDAAQIPEYVEKSVKQLQMLEDKIKASAEAGRNAARAARDAEGRSASFHFWEFASKQREVIGALQASGIAQARAIETFSEAQKLTFDYLSDVTRILRGLFILGCASLAKNRSVVRELEARLRGESESQINELARQELETLLVQLNEQRDILERQEQLGRNQSEQAEQISQNRSLIQDNSARNDNQDKELARQRDKDAEHDNELERQRNKDAEHDRLLMELSERIVKIETFHIPLWLKIAIVLNALVSVTAIALSLLRQ